MAERTVDEKKLHYMEYINRETDNRHHTHAEDMLQYDLLKAGDPRAVEEGVKMFSSKLPGNVSDDPVRNYKYLFVACITLCSRAAIYGGMNPERAYNISDLYILKMDTLESVDAIKALHKEMFTYFTEEMARLDQQPAYSRAVSYCMDYIFNHLHVPIRVETMANNLGLSSSYLSTLFRRETGTTITGYTMSKRMEASQNMLKCSDDSYGTISSTLAFSSQSHFIRAFKKYTGFTPKEYRDRYYDLPPH